MDMPETRYATTIDGFHIAYQVCGDGPIDLVYAEPYFSHLELNWQQPKWVSFITKLAGIGRVILFDRRGNGLSDPVPLDTSPPLEARIDDIRAVMDAVESDRAVMCGYSESAALTLLFAALHPERTIAVITMGGFARYANDSDYPWGEPIEDRDPELALVESSWGTEEYVRTELISSTADDALIQWYATLSRMSMSPGAALAYTKMIWEIDVRGALASVHVPTLILHGEYDRPGAQKYLADHIMGAELVALQGVEHDVLRGDQRAIVNQIERFVAKVGEQDAVLDRVLSTVMFTDIVDSTTGNANLGDLAWRAVIENHHATVRSLLARFRGHEVDTAGDGFFATFDGPARAVRCAQAITEAVRPLGIEIRAGVHTGEVQTIDGKCAGMGVVIGARVGARPVRPRSWSPRQ